MRVPARIGEGLSGMSLANTPERGVALKEVLNEISANLSAVTVATEALVTLTGTAALYGDFQTAVAAWSIPASTSVIQPSSDA